jgi:hypothetical protein
MAVTRRKGYNSRKRRLNSKKKFNRGKGVYQRPPSFLPIPPPQPPSLPRPPASYMPIPPPPKPLFIEPSPNHFIIRSQSPQQGVQKKPKAKQAKAKSEPLLEPAKTLETALEPAIPQQRRSLRQLIINSDKNKKIKRR